MLKKYAYMGLIFQWEEGTQPAAAVPVEDEPKPKAKARTTRNKAAKPANKAAADD